MRKADPISRKAKTMFDEHEGPLAFENAVFRCLAFGTIIKKGDWFFMAERVVVKDEEIQWNSEEDPNCWFIWWASAGVKRSIGDYMKEADFPLPYIAWYRRKILRVYTWEQGEKYGRRW